MHDDAVRRLKKQKQLIEMEIYEYKSLQERGKRGLHSRKYYIKLSHAWSHINKAIKLLSSTEDDIFDDFKYIEQ